MYVSDVSDVCNDFGAESGAPPMRQVCMVDDDGGDGTQRSERASESEKGEPRHTTHNTRAPDDKKVRNTQEK